MHKLLPLIILFCGASIIYAQSAQTRANFQKQNATSTAAPTQMRIPLSVVPQYKRMMEEEQQRLKPAGATVAPKNTPSQTHAALPTPPEFSPDFSISTEWSSRYMRNGWCRNDKPVGIIQAEFHESVGYAGFRGIYDFTETVGREWKFQEAWFYAGAAADFADVGDFGLLTVDLSWCHNVQPGNSGENHGEISLGFFLGQMYQSETSNLTSGLQFDYDYDRHAVNAHLHLRYDRILNQRGTLRYNLSGILYWGDTKQMQLITEHQRGEHGFYSAICKTGLEWDFAENWTLSPELSFAYVPERPTRRIAEDEPYHHPAILWGGIRITFHW